MGSFLGHVVPGTFFLLFSVWWTFSIFQRYFEVHFRNKFCRNSDKIGKKNRLTEYRNASSFLCRRRRRHGGNDVDVDGDDDEPTGWPVESWLKLIAVVIGILGELATGFDPNGEFVMHNGQVNGLSRTKV